MSLSAKSEYGNGKVDWRQTQGHTFCGVPNPEQVAAYIYGERPVFQNNRWTMTEAVRAFITGEEQIWMYAGDYFIIRNGFAVSIPQPEY